MLDSCHAINFQQLIDFAAISIFGGGMLRLGFPVLGMLWLLGYRPDVRWADSFCLAGIGNRFWTHWLGSRKQLEKELN